ncbi:hypothetical protein TWF694_009544 [Orbilia ellipsospora]|uniref:Uncharacterized protein n=1 Tax=Orbilia ellipsospora TaxID=2528407 RepID=A0AAV9XC64_9PEZI
MLKIPDLSNIYLWLMKSKIDQTICSCLHPQGPRKKRRRRSRKNKRKGKEQSDCEIKQEEQSDCEFEELEEPEKPDDNAWTPEKYQAFVKQLWARRTFKRDDKSVRVEDNLTTEEKIERHRRLVRELNFSPSPEPDEGEPTEPNEEEPTEPDEEELAELDEEEFERHEQLVRELNFSPSPEPDEEAPTESTEMTEREKENARITKYRHQNPHLSKSLLRCMDKQVMKGRKMRASHAWEEKLRELQVREVKEKIKAAKKAGIKKADLPPWEIEMPGPQPKSAIQKIVRSTRKHTKRWLQAQECLNAPRKPLPKRKPEPPKPTDGTFHLPDKCLHTSWFSYNSNKLGPPTTLSHQDFDRPFIAAGLKRTRNIMTKCNFPNTRRS